VNAASRPIHTAQRLAIPAALVVRRHHPDVLGHRHRQLLLQRRVAKQAHHHSKLIERTFGETRQRVKVIGRLPGERSCLSLVWAVLDRASHGWRGVQQTIPSIRLLAEFRRELFNPIPIDHDEGVITEAVTSAA